jgi:hypothetical protein
MTALWNPFTTEDLEEMDRCMTKIALHLLMAAAVVYNTVDILDARMPSTREVTAS